MSQALNRRTMILLGLTIVAGVYLIFDLTSSSKAPRPPRKAPPAPPAVARALEAVPTPTPGATPTASPGRRLAPPPPPDQPWGRDPFAIDGNRLPHGPEVADQFSGFNIAGIVRGPHGYQAIINDRVVRPGDQVDGARVVRITSEGIELEKDGETRFLPLIEKGILR